MKSDFQGMKVLIVGLGLMGCAFADGIKGLKPQALYGIDKKIDIINQAEKSGLIDKGFIDTAASEIISQCDFIVVCLYLEDAISFMKNNMQNFKQGSIITDIVGVKRKIINEVKEIMREDIDYIPGHPMAGKEKVGFAGADKSIFSGRNYILTPTSWNKESNIEQLKKWIYSLGFGHIVIADPMEHDKIIAYTSQLCHIIASSMVDMNDDGKIIYYEGGSFKDMTRIAMINSRMWTELFIANKDMLVSEIDKFIKSMESFKNMIQMEDDVIIEKLDEITLRRESLNNR